MKLLCVFALLIPGAIAYAGVDDYFPRGLPNAEWSSSLATLQQRYPEGFLYPVASKSMPYHFVVPGTHKELGLHVPVRAITFGLSADGTLHVVWIHLDNSNPDTVLYDIAEALGENYTTQDVKNARNYGWKPGATTSVALQIARPLPTSWALLALSRIDEKSSALGICQCD